MNGMRRAGAIVRTCHRRVLTLVRCEGDFREAGDMSGKYRAIDVARWFIAWAETADDEERNDLTNLKLQKLLYYTQGASLAERGAPVFSDEIEAWSHGPVVRNVYHAFKEYGKDSLELRDSDPFDFDEIDEDTTDLLIRVWNTYGGYSPWKLRTMTHSERPWQAHFKEDKRYTVIPQEAIYDFFTSIRSLSR